MAVTADEVRRMAELAQLDVPPAELVTLARELGQILDHMEALAAAEGREADADGHAGADHTTERLTLRPDVPNAEPLAVAPDGLAPAWADGFFTVPRRPEAPPDDAP